MAATAGGIPEAVEHEATGLLVPPGDPVALADAIQWLLEHPAERKHMGEAGRQLARERFDMRKWAARLAEIYRELASSSPCRP